MKNEKQEFVRTRIIAERRDLVGLLDGWLEKPMLVLGFVWLGLLVVELTGNLTPAMEAVGAAIWIIFILDFALKFVLAPDKSDYLKSNWLTALSLAIPALRVFRVFRLFRFLRAARAARGVRLFRVLATLNRGMRALGASMGRRGFGYVVALSVIVALAGAGGMFAFENETEGGGIKSYSDALWWTAMMLTTIGSEYFPRTAEGRILCFLLALYGFAVFGYVTAALATFFVGRDAADAAAAEVVGSEDVKALRGEITLLREELRALRNNN